jgi:hypothetical protein
MQQRHQNAQDEMDNVVGHGFVVEKIDIKIKYLFDRNAFK